MDTVANKDADKNSSWKKPVQKAAEGQRSDNFGKRPTDPTPKPKPRDKK
jgi:hypothetical protein